MVIERPILIDFQDGPCPHCQEWQEKKFVRDGNRNAHACDECGQAIPILRGMGGLGFQAVIPHHLHIRPVNGGPVGREGVFQELCPECYIAHRTKHFPSTDAELMRRTIVEVYGGNDEYPRP